MSDETEQFILGDAAVDATAEGRRGLRRRRRRRKDERVLTHCENCGTPLTGEFCSACGQHAIDYRRSLWRVLIDAADSFLNWDTKFLASIGVLLSKPWKLTNDFNAGRRARYVHPLRLYLLASIAFFLMFKFVKIDDNVVELGPQDRAEMAALLGKFVGPDSVLTADQQAKVDSLRARISQGEGAVTGEERDELEELVKSALATKMKERFAKGERAKLKQALRRLPEIPKPPSTKDAAEMRAKIDSEVAEKLAAAGLPTPSPPPEAERAKAQAEAAADIAKERATAGAEQAPIPPIDVPAPPAEARKHRGPGIHFGSDDKPKTPFESWMEGRIKSKVGEDGTRGKLFLQTLLNNVPTMMLCCVPLFALVLKLLYIRKRRYYVEHLVYALHIHTFIYVGVTVVVLCAVLIAQWSDVARALFSTACGFVMFGLVFLSIRRVYGEGWFFSTLKFILGGIAYFVVLIIAVGTTAFITLLLPD